MLRLSALGRVVSIMRLIRVKRIIEFLPGVLGVAPNRPAFVRFCSRFKFVYTNALLARSFRSKTDRKICKISLTSEHAPGIALLFGPQCRRCLSEQKKHELFLGCFILLRVFDVNKGIKQLANLLRVCPAKFIP